MKLRHLLVAAVLVASIPSISMAQQSRSTGWDFGVDLNYLISNDVGFDGGSSLDFDDDLGASLTFGYRFNPRLELGFGMDWNSVDYRGVLQSATIPSLTANISGEMEAFTFRTSGVFNFLDGPLTPFVSGGIGWSWIDTNIPSGQVQVGCWWDPWYGQICTPYQPTLSIDELTYQAGLGLRWDISDYYTLRFSYQKMWIDLDQASAPDFDQIKAGFIYRY
jgi:opacity protein-like surface antigen